MTAGISGGRLVALHSGRCDITTSLAVQGINVLTRQHTSCCLASSPLSPGIRLLAAGNYPLSARPQRRYRAGPMSSIELSAGAFPRDSGGVRSRPMASAGVICRVSARCAIAPLTPAAEKDVPSHVAYPLAL